MAQAEVGALRVVLGMDIAQFSEGGKKAQDILDRLAGRIGITAGVASAAGTLIGNALARAAEKIVEGMKSAIDATAEMADAADKFGISIQTVSAIVTQGEVPIASLTAALDGLQQSIFKVASNDTSSTAAQAFNAIGVSALGAGGKMRSVSDVIKDIADKFELYRDGIAKDALATALFGQKGAELVTVLSKGSAGIRELTDEAIELGNGLDSKAGAAAQAFKATLAELGKSFDVVYRQIAIKILPIVKDFTVAFADWVKGTVDVRPAADRISSGINSIYIAALETSAGIQRLGINLKAFWDSSIALFTDAEVAKIQQAAADAVKKIDDDLAERKKRIQEVADNPAASGPLDEQKGQQEPPIIQHTQKLTEAQRELNKQIQEGVNLAKQAREPYQVFADNIRALDAAQMAAKINAEQYGAAQRQAALIAVNAYAGAASSIGGSLTQVFQKSKAVAIAAAMINSFQAASNALAQAPWPLNFAAAAAALAAGFAQVANIRSTNESSSGGGGGASSGGGETAAPAQASQTLRVEGLDPTSLLSGDVVRAFAQSLLQFQADGGKVVL